MIPVTIRAKNVLGHMVIGDDGITGLHICSEIGGCQVPARLGFVSIIRSKIHHPTNRKGRCSERKESARQSGRRVAKKLKLQERRAVIPSRRSLAACRPLGFWGD